MLEPFLKQYLPEAIGKLGGYYSVTFELICAARDRSYRVFQNVQVEPFQIQMPASLQESSWRVYAEIQLLFFISFIHAISGRDSFALVRVLATCATSSSSSTAAFTYLEYTVGS